MITKPLAAAALLLALGASACGSTSSTTPTTASRPVAVAKAPTADDCISQRIDAKRPRRNLWVGSTELGDWIRVMRFPSAHDARAHVRAATEVVGASGGRYAVYGPNDSEAKVIVPLMARCLKGATS
jgi:hypothetical protein